LETEKSFNPQEWKDWVLQHEQEDLAQLALRLSTKKDFPLTDLLNQVKGRQIAKHKLPEWYKFPDLYFPDGLILEQCSSEASARFKAKFTIDKKVLDLTGGLGVDSLAFSTVAKNVTYCEPDQHRCAAAKYNFHIFQKEIEVCCGDAATLLNEGIADKFDLIYLDPSRRSDSGKKIFRIEDLQPDVIALKKYLLEYGATVIVKLAPMLDISEGLRQLPETFRVDVISWKSECKELLFHFRKGKHDPQIFCHDLEDASATMHYDFYNEFKLQLSVSTPLNYIYEPHAAIRKAGAWKSLCQQFNVSILHANTHLFTSQEKLNFPGRTFKLIKILPYKKDSILDELAGRNAQMIFYNFPEEAKKVKQKLKILSGEPMYLFFVTLQDGRAAVLFCERCIR